MLPARKPGLKTKRSILMRHIPNYRKGLYSRQFPSLFPKHCTRIRGSMVASLNKLTPQVAKGIGVSGEMWMGLLRKWKLLICLVLGAFLAPAQAYCQFSRDPADFLRRLDENGDGRLERSEFERMPSFLRDRLRERIDMNRSYRIEEIADIQRRMFEEMRAGGNFGGPGGGLPSPIGGSSGERRDSSRPDDSRRDSGRGDFSRGDSSRSDSGRSSDSSRSDRTDRPSNPDNRKGETKKKERTPIVARLPDAYLAKDTNRDNQIGLYEWSRNDIEGFKKLDRNRDGFLTPQELGATAGTKPTIVASANPVPSTSSQSDERSRTDPSRGDSGRGDSRRDRDSGDRRSFGPPPGAGGPPGDPRSAAETSFGFMDRDRDGKLSEDEWKNSIRARPMFEKAKIEVKLPMAKEDFVAKYVQASSSGS